VAEQELPLLVLITVHLNATTSVVLLEAEEDMTIAMTGETLDEMIAAALMLFPCVTIVVVMTAVMIDMTTEDAVIDMTKVQDMTTDVMMIAAVRDMTTTMTEEDIREEPVVRSSQEMLKIVCCIGALAAKTVSLSRFNRRNYIFSIQYFSSMT